jgi:hypothetical protein
MRESREEEGGGRREEGGRRNEGREDGGTREERERKGWKLHNSECGSCTRGYNKVTTLTGADACQCMRRKEGGKEGCGREG